MPSKQQLIEVIRIQSELVQLGLDLGGVMAKVVERTLPLIRADGAAIELAEGEDMVYRAAAGIATPYLGLRLKKASSLSGQCVQTGKTLSCDDSEADPRVDREACRKVGLRSMIVMPLKHQGETVGVLKAMSAQPGKFGEGDVELLGLLSEVVGAAMFLSTKYDSDSLFHRATHDEMTGLANRSLFMDRLRAQTYLCNRNHQQLGILMIDMDGLKEINDTQGHLAGDACIGELARRLGIDARLSDTIARLGGDEFGAILVPVNQREGLEAAVQRMYAQIGSPFEYSGRVLHFSASIGAALFPDDVQNIEGLIDLADQRMYEIKAMHHGRADSAQT